jgi:hypothetical protein
MRGLTPSQQWADQLTRCADVGVNDVQASAELIEARLDAEQFVRGRAVF